MSVKYRHLEPSPRDNKFEWSLPFPINGTDIVGSVSRNIGELENVFRETCCGKAMFPGEDIHRHAAMIHQALYVLKEVLSACVPK